MPQLWTCHRRTLDLSQRGEIMGILNTTPDSFSDGGRHARLDVALDHARCMISAGAAIIDIGGESTRPGAAGVDTAEEIARILPILRALRSEWDGWISIDTMKAEVAAIALDAGADIVNDVTGLRDPAMVDVCVRSGCAVVVMHMQGEPRTMQAAPHYEDVVSAVREFFAERHATLTAAGIAADCLCYDPGIGFGKSLDHNLALLRELHTLAPAGRPMLLGVSRKSFIGKILGSESLEDRAWPTVAITSFAADAGVPLHRVHDVLPNLQALRMTEAIRRGK